MKIAISAETTIDLTPELLKEFDIKTLPFTLVLGEDSVLDGQISPDELFAYTEKTGQLPRTSAVNQFQYEEHFRPILQEYDVIIHFALSSKISSACSNAIAASEEEEFKGKVFIIDTLSLSTGIALQAIYARKLARIGKDPEEIVDLCKQRIRSEERRVGKEC